MIPTRTLAVAQQVIVAGWIVLGALGCSGGDAAKPPRTIVIVTLDTFRVDRIGAYGHTGGLTPQLDEFAATGVRFERCLTVAPITLPAHASILSGVDPIAHGLRVNGVGTLPSDVPMIQESVKKEGFATGAFVSSTVLERRHGLARGFDVYDDKVYEDDDDSPAERTGEHTVAAALRFLDTVNGRDVFLWVHLFDAHAPYLAHPGQKVSGAIPYEGELAYVDSCFGQLREGLAKRNRSDALLAVVADHGEGLGEHGESTHTLFVYDTTIHVPWLLAGPGIPARRTLAGTVSTISLAPTLLDLAGLPCPAAMYGRSLASAARGVAAIEDGGVRFESKATEFYYGLAPLSGFEREQSKLIVAPRNELYFPLRDPQELANRFDAERPVADARKRELDAWEREHGTQHADPPPLTDEQQSALAQLGYVSVTSSKVGEDPKDGIGRVEGLLRAQLRAYDDPIGARQDLEEFVKLYPEVAEAYELLGDLRLQTGLLKPALKSFEHAIGLRPRDPGLHVKLGNTHLALGDLKSALAAIEFALSLEPNHVEAGLVLAKILVQQKKPGEALAQAVRVSQLDPERVEALVLIALTAFQTGDRARAGDAMRKALGQKPRDVSLLMMLAQIAGALEDQESRCQALNRALTICVQQAKGASNPQCEMIQSALSEAGCK